MSKSFLDLINANDNFPHGDLPEDIYTLKLPHDDRVHGLMRPEIVRLIPWTDDFKVTHSPACVKLLPPAKNSTTSTGDHITASFQRIINTAIDLDIFRILDKRHSEPYLIPGSNSFAHLERYAQPLFGILARGAHLTAFTRDSKASHGIKIWVPRRSKHLFTYPGQLDSSVAGGVKATDSPLECIVQESMEEASLSEEFCRQYIKDVGTLTYVAVDQSPPGCEANLISPEILYLYDLELPGDVVPKPQDDEVEKFELMSVEDVVAAMRREEFKTNSAVVLVDFLVRWGIVTEESEGAKDFGEIVGRMRRELPVALAPEETT